MSLRTTRTQVSHGAVADAAGLEASGDYSYSFDVRVNTAPTAGQTFTLIGKGDNDATSQGNYFAQYENSGGTLQLVVGHYDTLGTQRVATTAQTLTAGRNYAIAVTYNDTSKDIITYVAALEWRGTAGATTYTAIDTTALSGAPKSANTDPLRIGCGTDGTNLQNGSDIDVSELALYSAVLSSGTLDGRLGTRLDGTEASLLGYWPLNEEQDAAFCDRSGNGLDGTLERHATWSDDPTDLKWTTGLHTLGVVLYNNALWHPASSYAATTEATGYEASRLRSPRQQLTTRSTTVVSTYAMVATLGRRVPVACLTIAGHNLTSAATITIDAAQADSWPGDLTPQTVTWHPERLIFWFARPWCYDFWRLAVTDTGNPDGYIELGTVGLWAVWEGDIYAPIGEAEHVTDTSRLVTTPHGDTTVRDLDRHRSASATWSVLRYEHAAELRRVLELWGTGYIGVMPDPQRRGINGLTYGAVTQLPSHGPHRPAWVYASQGALTVEADY